MVRVDRLSRNLAQLAQIAELLQEAEVSLVSATEPFDTSYPAGRMLFQMLGSFAEFERGVIIDRVTQGIERRIKSGKWTSGTTPFGYRRSEDPGILEPDPLAAPIVEEVFRLYTQKRLGTRAIAQRLNEQGKRTQKGNRFSGQAVVGILRNRAYLGMVPLRGEYFDGEHAALIDAGLFETAQALLSERAEKPALRRTNASEYLLSGVIRCERCGSAYVGMQANGNGGRYEYYACRGRNKKGREFCDNDHLPRRALETAVIGQLTILLARTDLLQEAWKRFRQEQLADAPALREEVERVLMRRSQAEQRRQRYFTAFERGQLDPALCQDRLAELKTELAEFDATAQTMQSELASRDEAEFPERAVLAARREIEEFADQAPKAKALLRLLIAEISVRSREHIQPTYRRPQSQKRSRFAH